MKILLLSIYLLLSSSLSTPIFASDLEKLYPQQLAQAKNLYPLAKQYFTGPGSLPPGETLTPEMVTSRIRLNQFYKLRRLLGLAIDAGYDLSYMAEFGLIKQEQGYYIDFKQHPQWASMSSLFIRLRESSDLTLAEYYLAKKGFSQSNIDSLREYLIEKPAKIIVFQAEQSLLKTRQEFLTNAIRSQGNDRENSALKGFQHEILTTHEMVRKIRFDSWNQWAVGLLNSFEKQQQRILLDYLQNRLGSMAIGGAPINEAFIDNYGKELISGKAVKDISEQLTLIKKSMFEETTQ